MKTYNIDSLFEKEWKLQAFVNAHGQCFTHYAPTNFAKAKLMFTDYQTFTTASSSEKGEWRVEANGMVGIYPRGQYWATVEEIEPDKIIVVTRNRDSYHYAIDKKRPICDVCEYMYKGYNVNVGDVLEIQTTLSHDKNAKVQVKVTSFMPRHPLDNDDWQASGDIVGTKDYVGFYHSQILRKI